MRSRLSIVAIALFGSTAALAASLPTAARVELVQPTVATLAAAEPDAVTWQLQGTPADRLQVAMEVRDAAGDLVEPTVSTELALDAAGQAAASLPTPTGPHDALPTVTLVIIRE